MQDLQSKECGDCGKIHEYLVRKMMEFPEGGCMDCKSPKLSRVWNGSTFSTITKSTRIAPDGSIHVTSTDGSMEIGARTDPGIYVSGGG